MNTKEYLNKVAYIDNMEIGDDVSKVYKSKFDDSYITHVGMEENIKYLAKREITDNLTHGVGFSPKDCKWYGWSHRAIYGFKIGSTCKKDDCHYVPKNELDAIEDAIRFWSDDDYLNIRVENLKCVDSRIGVEIKWEYSNDSPNKKLRGKTGGVFHYFPEKYGRGEWIAKTIEEAKQMAVDFSDGVS